MAKQSMPLGTILTNKGWIEKETLRKALKMQGQKKAAGESIALGDLLIRAGKITKTQLDKALELQKKSSTDILRSRTEIEEIHGQLTVQYADTTTRTPFVDEGYSDRILVAENLSSEPVIVVTPEFHAEYKNVFMSVRQRVLNAYTGVNGRPQIPKIIRVSADLLEVYRNNDDEASTSGPRTDVEDEFEGLVKKAYEAGAVDLHFFRKSDVCTVRFRVNSELRTWSEWNPEKADKVINVGFQSFGVGSKYTGWDQKMKQRVRIRIRYSQHISLDCRYEHAPGDDGAYHACIRILANDKRDVTKQISLRGLGFTKMQDYALESSVSMPSGLILMSGPTGSGKSTTVASLIKFINRDGDVNVLTVESPIERELPAFQTTVSDDEKGNRNEFADAIKSMLRRDPDVGFVGELRDEMSTSACASGVQTGHTMISTVHAQSGIEIVERLASPAMKLAPETIGAPSFINALVFQMLIPLLDQETKVRLTKSNLNDYMDERQRDRFLRLFPDFDSKNMYVRGKSPQNPEGLKGMSICAEVVIPDDYMRTCFRKMELAEALNYWRRLGAKDMHKPLDERITGLTAADVAIAKTEAGLVDPRDLEGRFGHLDLLANKRQALLEMFKKSEAA